MRAGDSLRTGLPRRNDIVGIRRVGDGFAVLRHRLAADGGEFLLRELLPQNEALTAGGQQRGVLLPLIDHGQRRRIVDGGYVLQVPQLGVVHKGQRHQRTGGHQRAYHDKGRPPPLGAGTLVGQMPEQRQHEQRQHIVQRHDDA